jgi:hypothetical protein
MALDRNSAQATPSLQLSIVGGDLDYILSASFDRTDNNFRMILKNSY